MDLDTAAKIGNLAFAVAQAIVLLFIILMKGTFATRKDVKSAHDRADDAHNRRNILDERLKGYPGYDVTNELRADFAEMSRLHAMTTTELRLLREIVQRMDDFLRQHK